MKFSCHNDSVGKAGTAFPLRARASPLRARASFTWPITNKTDASSSGGGNKDANSNAGNNNGGRDANNSGGNTGANNATCASDDASDATCASDNNKLFRPRLWALALPGSALSALR
jgi:hypothetical protein